MKRQLIVGMPESGKSTFIAALRHLLLSGTFDTDLELTGLADEERHLNDLERDWLEFREVQRTKPATEGWVQFRVQNRTSGAESVLYVPDLRGEAFEEPICAGQCQRDLYEAFTAADGIMLFTNAERQDDALMISDLGDLIDGEEDEEGVAIQPFNPYDMPEEVKIVEFLQIANRRPLAPRKRQIALMISAWDIVPSGVSPDAWLREKRPMLSQFLEASEDLWEVRVYGVSAQGGRLPQDKRRLSRLKSPVDRIQLVGHGANKHDLSSPLRWLGT